jgi:calcineurin-like phosphoesterase family protein
MNDAMVDLWNSEVPKDADVWHLGDFCFAGAAQWKDLRDRLNGHIHLVLGNHDGVASGPMLSLFDSIHPGIAHLRVENRQEIWLSHFPLLCWTGCSRGAWNLFGHVHTMKTQAGCQAADCGTSMTSGLTRITTNQYRIHILKQ